MENKLRWGSDRTVIGRELQTQISFELNGQRSIAFTIDRSFNVRIDIAAIKVVPMTSYFAS